MGPHDGDGSLPSVPRSKGCITCVARKTRCDGRQPTCRACEDRKQVCRGYRRSNFVFLNEGWRAPGVASQPGRQKSRIQQRHKDVRRTTSMSPKADGEVNNSVVLPAHITPDPMQIYIGFFLSQFAVDLPREGKALHDHCRRCFSLLLNKQPTNANINGESPNPVIDAAEALVKCHFGRLNGSSRLLQESTRAYSCALGRLSIKLDEVQRVGIPSIREDEWLDLMFSCLMLAFWELAMNPNSTGWQNHIRGLADIIDGRGPEKLWSATSLEMIPPLRLLILLESISSKRPTFLSLQKWQRLRSFRAYPDLNPTLHSSINRDEAALMASRVGPRRYVDFILDGLLTLSTIMAEFNDLCKQELMGSLDPLRLERLEGMQKKGLAVLQQAESVLEDMQASIGTFSRVERSAPAQVSDMQNLGMVLDLRSFISSRGPSFGKPLEYNFTSLCRTAAMSLRLLMCDLINFQGATDLSSLEEQRTALMVHAEAVLCMIPYSSRQEIFGMAPVCFVPAFRLAKTVLVRECEMLKAEMGRETDLERCNAMKEVVQRHLEFVASKKISIKVDF